MALFDLEAAKPEDLSLYELKTIGFDFDTAGTSRYLTARDLLKSAGEELG